jgi:ribosomal protein L31E
MTEPITAIAIATLAFQKAIEAVGSEVGKKFAASAYELMNNLREKIWNRFKGNETVEVELQKADTGDRQAVEAVADYLKVAMRESPEFASELQLMANEINLHLIEDNSNQVQVNYGGTNFQTKVEGGEVYQGNITIHKT